MMKNTQGFLWADVSGTSLTAEDREILAHPLISGVILFAHNYENPAQLRALTQSIKAVSPHIIITVDQEGGRVQRFREGFTELPAMGTWGSSYAADPIKTTKDFSHYLSCMVKELQKTGVYSTLAPVLDIDFNRNAVIGHRSFGGTADTVIALADFFVDQFHALQMPVTGKHFPGHGWVTLDSHFELPIDERSYEAIEAQDLKPFSALSQKLDAIMLAHVVYQQLDAKPVCFSPFWIKTVLRQKLRFDGLVMSDCMSMKAVTAMGSYADRTEMALEAGCDVVLVCNARDGVIDVLDHVALKKNDDLARRMQHYARFSVS